MTAPRSTFPVPRELPPNSQLGTRNPELGTRRLSLLREDGPRSGAENMALDQTLLDLAGQTGQAYLRIYRWLPFCLSFGRHEPALRRYDRAAIGRLGLDVVRRPTGGRAVWHARELTYAVAAPVGRFGTLAETYCRLHQVLARAVQSLGVEATLATSGPSAGVGSGACFACAAGGEVMVRSRKLIGSAQLRQGTAFLQHGSLLLEDDQEIVREITVPPLDQLGAGRPPSPVGASREITLQEAAGRMITFEEASEVVVEAFGGALGMAESEIPRFAPDDISAYVTQFRDPAWTWRR